MALHFFGPEYTTLAETQAICETVLHYNSFHFSFVMPLKTVDFFPFVSAVLVSAIQLVNCQ